jgi:hypothetical protein
MKLGIDHIFPHSSRLSFNGLTDMHLSIDTHNIALNFPGESWAFLFVFVCLLRQDLEAQACLELETFLPPSLRLTCCT